VVLTPRRWRQVSWSDPRERRWQQSPVTWESTKETVKTIARGMPDVSGVTVVTNACAFYHCARGCGRAERPAFPAPFLGVALRPLIEQGGTPKQNSREMSGEIANVHLKSEHRHCERSEAIHAATRKQEWIASLRSQ
jgi:hypothetical protein